MTSRTNSYSGRSLVIQLFLVIGFLSLLTRLFYIQIYQEEFIKKQVNSRTILEDTLLAKRGEILDRNKRLLAIDIKGHSIVLDLQLFKPNSEQLATLSNTLGLTQESILMKAKKKNRYIELIRHIEDTKKTEIERLDLQGIFFKRNLKRSYPQQEISSHVVGITDIDRIGIQGVEKVLEKILKGKDGSFSGIRSPIGVIGGDRSSAVDGQDLQLTIDIRLQSIAYHELYSAVQELNAQSGSIILVEPKSSNILALTNFPSFNPSNRSNINDLSVLRNRASIDVFEPGSVIKPLAMAAMIDSGQINTDTVINTSPGWVEFGGYKTSDFRDYGLLNLSEIISYSSNVGMVKLCDKQKPELLHNYFSNFGVGKLPSNILISSREGFLPSYATLSDRDKVSLCYGYGLSMTALQIAQAYQVFANNGVYKELNLFMNKKFSSPVRDKRILSQETSKYISKMLYETVHSTYGTGKLARIEGIQVSGKTGTAEKIWKGNKSYTATFAGFAPSNNPKLLIVVVLYNLSGEVHSGGSAAAPVASKVLSQSLHALESGSL